MRLQNQVAIVTGAGRNIGEDIAKLFVQEGARVAVVDLDPGRSSRVANEINAKNPGRAIAVVCDVASPTPRQRYAADLDALLSAVAPTPTVVLSLPDMAVADRLAEPLRTLAGLRSRWFESARARVASTHPHVTSVDIASRPPGLSRRAARSMLCTDRFHPGANGYRLWAERIAKACDERLEAADHPVMALA